MLSDPAAVLEVRGGANIPASIGRVNATWPLALLSVSAAELGLRVRPGLLIRSRLVMPKSTEHEIFPVRGPLLRTSGIGIDVGHQSWYFWTSTSRELVDTLGQLGYHTDTAVRSASQSWKVSRGGRSDQRAEPQSGLD
jgi:hypothetical protein